jgi:outer membrane protein assembly factor BamB
MSLHFRSSFVTLSPCHLVTLSPGLLALTILLSPVTAADWPQFRGPNRDGTSPETGLATTWPREGPPLLWQKKIGTGYSGPVIVGDRLILFHRLGDKEVVDCIRTTDQKSLWTSAYPTAYEDDFGKGDGPRSTPVVAQGRVYTLGAEGMLHCLDLLSGKKRWERSLLKEYRVPKNFFGVGTTPLVEGDLVLVNVGGKGAGIVAFAYDTGKEVWRATNDGASYSSPVAATVDGVRHVMFFTREGVVSLDPATGKVRFRKPWRARFAASVNAASPVIVKDLLFISASYETGAMLLRIKKDAAQEIWKGDDILSNHYETSVYRDGHLYGFDGRQENGAQFRCVEFKTGKVRWTEAGFGCGTMILADKRLLVMTEKGELVLAEPTPREYREKARVALLQQPCRAPMALANGRLYVRDDKRLLCLDLRKP